ncbi:hypothetical protein ABBQ32_004279 [Trebouxia sp. C0010 RCD-2024]
MLVLANALQIKLVETACVDYLLELTLPAQQLGQVLECLVLRKTNTGKSCELQVLDMLLSAGFGQSGHWLPTLFEVGRVSPIAMQQFSQAADFSMLHSELLIAICN